MAKTSEKSGQERAVTADDACDFAIAIARLADSMKTDDVLVLDLRGLSSLADYFVIGTGTSDRQMHAVLDKSEDTARAMSRKPFKVADARSSNWILADYVDVVIHLFDREHRDFYDLDGLWGDAPRIEWREAGRAAASDG